MLLPALVFVVGTVCGARLMRGLSRIMAQPDVDPTQELVSRLFEEDAQFGMIGTVVARGMTAPLHSRKVQFLLKCGAALLNGPENNVRGLIERLAAAPVRLRLGALDVVFCAHPYPSLTKQRVAAEIQRLWGLQQPGNRLSFMQRLTLLRQRLMVMGCALAAQQLTILWRAHTEWVCGAWMANARWLLNRELDACRRALAAPVRDPARLHELLCEQKVTLCSFQEHFTSVDGDLQCEFLRTHARGVVNLQLQRFRTARYRHLSEAADANLFDALQHCTRLETLGLCATSARNDKVFTQRVQELHDRMLYNRFEREQGVVLRRLMDTHLEIPEDVFRYKLRPLCLPDSFTDWSTRATREPVAGPASDTQKDLFLQFILLATDVMMKPRQTASSREDVQDASRLKDLYSLMIQSVQPVAGPFLQDRVLWFVDRMVAPESRTSGCWMVMGLDADERLFWTDVTFALPKADIAREEVEKKQHEEQPDEDEKEDTRLSEDEQNSLSPDGEEQEQVQQEQRNEEEEEEEGGEDEQEENPDVNVQRGASARALKDGIVRAFQAHPIFLFRRV